jgi:glycine oxidase
MPPKTTADVVIIGGGVIGCMAAYYLTLRGLKPVVVESEGIATGASGFSGGILTPWAASDNPEFTALGRPALELHQELLKTLPAETGIDYGYDLRPYLRCVFTEDGARRLKAWAAARSKEGYGAEWLSPRQAKSLTPWLTGDITGALLTEVEPTIDSYRFTLAAMQAAESRGARMVSGRAAGLLEVQSGGAGRAPVGKASLASARKATGIKLAGGDTISAPHTVIAMGPWAGEASGWLGFEVPVKPQKGEMVYMDLAHGGHPAPKVALSAFDTGGAITPKRLTETIIGATRDDSSGFSRAQTPQARDQLIAQVSKLSKWVLDARLVRHTACLRPYPADGLPVVGRAPGWEGAWVAAGHWSVGVHFSALTGKWLADMIVDGKSGHDLSVMDAGRVIK